MAGFEPMTDQKKAYESIKNIKEKFGIFHKSCFHIHTPESYDYTLLKNWSHKDYEKASEQNIYDICIEKGVFPKEVVLKEITLENARSCYKDKKEMLSFFLLAETIISNNIEIVLVTDHNTINGILKLRAAIKELNNFRKRVYPEVLSGMEISCADKNHVVGIFEENENNKTQITNWLTENLLSTKDGSFRTSIDILEFIKSIGGIGYIAHINSSDIFKETNLGGAYKKRLFSDDLLQIVGLSDYSCMNYIKENIKRYRSSEIKFILDNDAHNIDDVSNNIFWIKGSKRNYSMIKEAFNDYDISVSFHIDKTLKQYIQGIYIENNQTGFLSGNAEANEPFCLNFSDALNCLIGGRGTGKSTVLLLLEFILSQHCKSDKELDFLCLHNNVWILYIYEETEYLIEMRMPIKSNSDDNILHYFGQNPSNRYGYRYYYNQEEIKEYAFKNLLKIYKVVNKKDDNWLLQTIKDKRRMLSLFFDVGYSVNELVATANSEKINSFIYNKLFENKTLSRPENSINFRSVSGLNKTLKELQSILEKRKEEVNSVVSLFNNHQTNTLRIVYSQNKKYEDPDFAFLLFGRSYDKKEWYNNYNITKGNIIEFLLALYDKLGIFSFLKMIISKDMHNILKEIRILDFCTEVNEKMILNGIKSLDSTNADDFVREVFKELVTDSLVPDKKVIIIKEYLKKYIANIESFSLEFNINNKEGDTNLPIIYKEVGALSLGQKVVAMLSFILGYSEYSEDYRPLIIDQPEDNLDNQYIYKNLVKQLRQIKEKRQVIVATHNATIVTNAKADQTCIMKSDNKHGWIETTGYPGEKRIKKHIINYLEGGKNSFLHKISIYKDALDN